MSLPSPIARAHQAEQEMWQALDTSREQGNAVDVLKKLYQRTLDEDKRLDREVDTLAGAKAHNQRIRQFILMFAKEAEATNRPTEPAQTASSAAPEPTPEEATYMAQLEAVRSEGKCDYTEGVGRPICGKKAKSGRCRSHA